MVRLFFIVIITFMCRVALSQVNLNLDIDARQLTPMKLSEIAEKSRYVALKMGNIFDSFVTDKFIFVSTGSQGALAGNKWFQYDLSGKLVRTFDKDNQGFGFRCDSKNDLIVLFYDKEIEVWDFKGTLLKKVTLPERITILEETMRRSVIGFDQKHLWFMQQFERNGKICCQINKLNIESERLETVLERDLPLPDTEIKVTYRVQYSSLGDKSYIAFYDNVIYEIDGKSMRPDVKYNIRNYRGELSYLAQDARFAGRFLSVKYGSNFFNYMLFWYDTKEQRSWQMKINNRVGGIEDDIYHTGACNNYQIDGDFLVFRKNSNDLPEEMNLEKEHTVFFITKLKQ